MMMMAEVGEQQQRTREHHAYHLYNTNTSNNTNTNNGKTSTGISTTNKKLKTGTTSSLLQANSFNKPISSKEKNDKFGERVAALQQLVSPFGKTDTASVLSEATGYIRFLHEQLQVLSAPYIGTPTMQNINTTQDEKYSLRRRGLCLMPITATQSLSQSNGADLWAPTKHASHNLHGVP